MTVKNFVPLREILLLSQYTWRGYYVLELTRSFAHTFDRICVVRVCLIKSQIRIKISLYMFS
jgi:hypothetical protein